jgi:hypothetical protein
MNMERLKKLGMAAVQNNIRNVMFIIAEEPEIILAAYFEIEELRKNTEVKP